MARKRGRFPLVQKKFSSVTVIHLASREPFGTFSHLTHIAVLRERAMANYMIVRQKVIDLAWFQTAFDRLKPNRKAAGLTDLGQFCADDESDVVIVVMKVEDMSRAKEYWHSNVLAQGRTEAGIVGPIEAKSDQVWLTDGSVKDRLTKPKRWRRPVDSEVDT